MLVAHSCPTLWDPMDYSWPGSPVCGIRQARILEWVAIPFSRGSSWPRNWTQVSHIAGRFFTIWSTREVLQWGAKHKWDQLYTSGLMTITESTYGIQEISSVFWEFSENMPSHTRASEHSLRLPRGISTRPPSPDLLRPLRPALLARMKIPSQHFLLAVPTQKISCWLRCSISWLSLILSLGPTPTRIRSPSSVISCWASALTSVLTLWLSSENDSFSHEDYKS